MTVKHETENTTRAKRIAALLYLLAWLFALLSGSGWLLLLATLALPIFVLPGWATYPGAPKFVKQFAAKISQPETPTARAKQNRTLLEALRDFVEDFLRNFHFVIGMLVLTTFLSILSAWLAGYPGGLTGFIATLYAVSCASGGACDLPTLHAGFTMASIIIASILLVFARLLLDSGDPHEETQEEIQTLQNQIDDMHMDILVAMGAPDDCVDNLKTQS